MENFKSTSNDRPLDIDINATFVDINSNIKLESVTNENGEIHFQYVYDTTRYTKEEYQHYIVEANEREYENIIKWHEENDYKINKRIRGEWAENDPRWIEYLNECNVKHQRLNELQEIFEKK